MNKRRSFVLCLTLFTVYCGFYLYIRSNHWIVHRSGFAFGNTDNHRVGFGRVATTQRQIAYLVYTPLRWAETAYWHLRYPVGKPWPYFDQPTSSETDD